MAFLGYIISSECIEVDQKKTKGVKNSPRLLTSIDIRIFLGLASYNRKFLDGLASISSPFTTLTI